MDRIREYYRICAVVPEALKPRPLVDQIDIRAIDVVFTKKQATVYIKSDERGVTIRENIVGGAKQRYDKVTVV